MKNAKEKILDSDKLRSFSSFFGIGESPGFAFTINPTVLLPRLKKNIIYFYLNYILLAAVIMVITVLATMINPKTLIMIGVLLVVWFFTLRATADDGLQLGPVTVTRKSATTLLMVITAIVLFFMVKSVFVVTLSSASVLALIHAILRDSSKYSLDGSNDSGDASNDSAIQMA